ncbi:MAG TPA: sigma-70 family RNA polymerase sigma factor [Sphingomicrobium sp.]|nr:sigma-70 family RNA polymerase sigma factor [Sphingomicrobium sp.]
MQLLDRIAARDVKAFEQLYRLYQPRLSRFLVNIVNRPQIIEEVLNDTMMAVWKTAANFRGASRVSTWIFAIAYRQGVKARSRWDEPLPDLQDNDQASPDALPDALVQQSRTHDALVDAMGSLSADHRAVVDLTYFHGMGYREIAEIMGCPVDTVKTRMFHARRKLQRVMPGDPSDWL